MESIFREYFSRIMLITENNWKDNFNDQALCRQNKLSERLWRVLKSKNVYESLGMC
jgi:hypothetical protein